MYKIVQLYSVHKNHSFEQICLPYLAEGTHKEYFAHLCGFGFKFLAGRLTTLHFTNSGQRKA